jgi:succinoglycan biosynthesis transport protein ExoP
MLLTPKREEPLASERPVTAVAFVIGFLQRQYLVLVASLLLAGAIGGTYLFFTRPAYTASATMIIDLSKGQFFQKSSVLGDTPTDSAWVDSQIGTLALQRDKVGLVVAKKLHLENDSDLVEQKSDFFSVLTTAIAGFFKSIPASTGSQPAPQADPAPQANSALQAGAAIGSRLEVKRVGFTYLVTIGFSSEKPEQAVKIANAAADAYVVSEMDAKFQAIQQASDYLQERYQTLREQASTAERAVVEFKAKHNIVTTGGKLINDQQLSEVNSRLVAARARTADAQAKLTQIEVVLQTPRSTGVPDATVAEALHNPIITKLQSQYLDLMNREADWATRFGKNHLAVVNLHNQARDVRNSIREELKRIAETYRSDFEIAKKNQEETESQLSDTISLIPNEAQITLRALESTAQSYRTYYDNFLQHYTESVQQQTSPVSETRIISYATGAGKSHPSVPRALALTLFGALALGVGLSLLRESLDGAFRTADQVVSTLQIECLALIPAVKFLQVEDSFNKKPQLQTSRHISTGSEAFRLVTDAPFSRFTESIRTLKWAADLRYGKNNTKVIGITSAVPGEGKSTIAAALARLLAQDEQVILVDCDLRNPALSQLLVPHAQSGIIEVISGQQPLEKVICTDPVSGLAFLPGSPATRSANTDQILASASMKSLFDALRSQYDYIIVDLSPLAPVVDVRATTGIVDSYIFLVEWGNTRVDVVQQVLKEARRVYENVLGVVLNKVDMNVVARYEGEHAESYRSKYFASYQDKDHLIGTRL